MITLKRRSTATEVVKDLMTRRKLKTTKINWPLTAVVLVGLALFFLGLKALEATGAVLKAIAEALPGRGGAGNQPS